MMYVQSQIDTFGFMFRILHTFPISQLFFLRNVYRAVAEMLSLPQIQSKTGYCYKEIDTTSH